MFYLNGNSLAIAGVVLALVGATVTAVPAFTTRQTSEVANIGNLTITSTEDTAHTIPPIVGPGALGVGLILVAAGLVIRR